MRSSQLVKVPLIVCTAAVILSARVAAGQTFLQIQPPTCPSFTTLAYSYKVGAGTGVFDLPSEILENCTPVTTDPCPDRYTNNLDNTRHLIGNAFTTRVDLRLSAFQTEQNYDWLEWGTNLPPNTPQFTISGTTTLPQWLELSVSNTTSLHAQKGRLRFRNDGSINSTGFAFDSARVCTSRAALDTVNPPIELGDNERYEGFLLGKGDVIYLKFAPFSSTRHYAVAMGGTDPATDFDLYVRCGAYPTFTVADAASLSANSQEFLDLAGVPVCNGQPVFVAIHSWSGAGHFWITRTSHTQDRMITAGTRTVATAPQLAAWTTALQTAARIFFGMTEGYQLIKDITLSNNGNCVCGGGTCDLCFDSQNTVRSSAGICSGTVSMSPAQNQWTNPRTIAHEWGHLYGCMADEYIENRCLSNCSVLCSDNACPCTAPNCNPNNKCLTEARQCTACGHTMMAAFNTQNNICTALDHNKDDSFGNTPDLNFSNGHQVMLNNNRGNGMPSITPDNYDYSNFSFIYSTQAQVGYVHP